jgi:hypothetical protein
MLFLPNEQRRPLRIDLVLEDFGKKFLRCGPRPHIGSLIGAFNCARGPAKVLQRKG